MVRQDSGNIVNHTPVECFIPFLSTVSYVASRFAVMGLSESLWVEGKDLVFNVSTVCSGIVSAPSLAPDPRSVLKDRNFVRIDFNKWRGKDREGVSHKKFTEERSMLFL